MKRESIIKTFMLTRSLTDTAEICGISRQRVWQVVDQEVKRAGGKLVYEDHYGWKWTFEAPGKLAS